MTASSDGFSCVKRSIGTSIARRYFLIALARSEKRTRAARSLRAASSLACTASIKELTVSGRFAPSAASRWRTTRTRRSRLPTASARFARRLASVITRFVSVWYVRSILSSLASSACVSLRVAATQSSGSAVFPRSIAATAVASSAVRSALMSDARAADSTCSIACFGVGAGSSGSTIASGSA